METVIRKIANLLEQSIGLSVTSIGAATFQRAVNNRKKVLGIADDGAYLNKITFSFMELRKLVEEVVVPETWFFRDQEPFKYLSQYINESKKDFGKDIFRILSLPCSTGEEPYSIAMTMFMAGLKPTNFYVDAVDVSARSLAAARKGLYKINSFRTDDTYFRDLYFQYTPEGYMLKPMVRDKVRFIRGNIVQPGFLDSMGRYDVVFCRNLLIYFDKKAQQDVIKGLHDILVANGLLFSGHSEASLFLGPLFVPAPHPGSFAFLKKPQQEPVKATAALPDPGMGKRELGKTRAAVKPVPAAGREKSIPRNAAPVLKPGTKDAYDDVQKLADSGKLEAAAKLCEEYLRTNGPSSKWYYLLGIIRDSQGSSDEALKFFRKAAYLDPDNADSLLQLSLLAEKAGNSDVAENYKRRAKKVLAKE